MNTQRQNEMTAPKYSKRPMLVTAISELAGYIADAKIELGALQAARHEAERSRDLKRIARAKLNIQQRLLAHFQLVHAMKATIIKKAVDRRLSQVTPCQFQMMVDGVPFYKFSDLETGVSFEGIAYGTEANRTMYQLKADLERAVRRSMSEQLSTVGEVLDAWKKTMWTIDEAAS